MSKFKPIRCLESSIPEEISDGALYITTDTEQLFVDTDSKRLAIKDVITVEDEASLPLAPVKGKLYVALSEKSLWTFTTEWVQIGSGSGGGGYVLPVASKDALGGVKIDDVTIKIDENGVISGIDAYTKTETDKLLDDKQDKLTPSAPLSITKEVRSNLEGFTYTTDSTGIYTNDSNVYYFGNGVSIYVHGKDSLVGGTNDKTVFQNCVRIPYKLNQWLKLPVITEYSRGHIAFLGKYTSEGIFEPIFIPKVIGGSTWYVILDNNCNITSYGNGYINITWSNTHEFSYTTAYRTDNANTYGLLNLKLSEDESSIIISTTEGLSGYNYRSGTVADANAINRLKEINCALIVASSASQAVSTYNAYIGTTSTNAIAVSNIGLYNADIDLSTLEISTDIAGLDLGENLYDLSGEQAYNYLDLNIDNNTLKINESNQLFANIPENLTTQGNEFNNANQLVQLDESGKLPAIDGSQLTNLPAGTAPTNMVTTDTNQTITGTKTIQKLKINGADRETTVLSISSVSSPATRFVRLGDLDGNYDYVRIESEGDAEILNSNASSWGKILDTRNFNTLITAGDNISITKNDDGKNSTYTISATASGGGETYTLPPATSTTLGGIKVGNNLSITDDGTLSATGSAPTNMVTTDTEQNITGKKQFTNEVLIYPPDENGGVLRIAGGAGGEFQLKAHGWESYVSAPHDAFNGSKLILQGDNILCSRKVGTGAGDNLVNIDSGNISSYVPTGLLKYWKGTETDYTAIETKDADTLYRTTDTNKVFLGTTSMGGSSFVNLTQAQYDELTIKDENTLYIITD